MGKPFISNVFCLFEHITQVLTVKSLNRVSLEMVC